MNQHEIMDNMTHEEFETINNKNSSDEEKSKAWNDASKRIETLLSLYISLYHALLDRAHQWEHLIK